jgi:hypothetical protein
MARNTITIYSDIAVSSCSGSGPSYTVNYGSSVANAQIGDWITAVHREAGDSGGDILSNYTYQVVGITDSDTLTVKYITDIVPDILPESGLGDDSPCDLNSGEGSSGSPTNSPHTFTRDLGSAFEMFVE